MKAFFSTVPTPALCAKHTAVETERDLTAVRTCFVYINHGDRINGLKYILFLGALVM